MGATYRFITSIEEGALIQEWFRALDPCPVENTNDERTIFYFKEYGSLGADLSKSPIVSVILARKHRGILTTAAEVHFLPTPATQFPELATINRRFKKWTSQFKRVYSFHREHDDRYYYYLESGLKNIDADIYALPEGLEALEDGNYFIPDEAAMHPCEDLCRQLRLRGVTGIQEPNKAVEDNLTR